MTLLPPADPASSLPASPRNPSSNAASATLPQQGGFDVWGPLQRRKYLIALFTLLGLLGGYLYYLNSPEVFSSSTRIMVTSMVPSASMLEGGQMRQAKESLSKHANLISSEMIFEDAATAGKFQQLDIFKDTTYPAAKLRSMIQVVTNQQDAMTLVCSGSNPDDLPAILNQIVSSYQKTVKRDSLAIGQKTVDLIRKLSDKINEEKQDDLNDRDQLWQVLNIQSTDSQGFAINPHNKPLADLQQQVDEVKLNLTEIQDRRTLLAKNLELDPETKEIDPLKISLAALEARDYLNLREAAFLDQRNAMTNNMKNLSPEYQERGTLQSRIWSLQSQIEDLRFERAQLSNKFGPGHSKIETIDSQIRFYQDQNSKLNADLVKINKVIQDKTNQAFAQEDAGDEAKNIDLKTFREREARDWVRKYQYRLSQESERLTKRLERLNEQIEVVSRKARAAAANIVKLNRLQVRIKQKSDAVEAMTDKLAEIDIVNNNYSMISIKTLDKPKRGAKVAPSMPKCLGIGAVLAFIGGLGLAILVDQSELAYRNPAEIFERLQVPVVGKIPRINTRQIEPAKGHASLVAAHKPSATAAESFRDVRTALFFRTNIEDVKTILFTSPSPGDGKSTTVCNLAISIAQAGKKTILVDADFRRPRVHQYFGQEMNPGLMNVLNGEMSLKDSIQTAELQENLFLLPSGGRPNNPGELVTSEAFANLIDALREKFDYVLIDSPPVLPVSDPATISSLVDGVYLVTRIRKGVKLTSQKAKETLDRVGANWMGVIVNGLDENPHYSEYGYQYGGYSYYGGMYGRYYDANNRVYRDKISPPQQSS